MASRLVFLTESRVGAKIRVEASLADCAAASVVRRAVKPVRLSPSAWPGPLREVAAELFPSSGSGLLLVSGDAGSEVVVDGGPPRTLPLAGAIPLAAGRHAVVLRREGFYPETYDAMIFGGLTTALEARLLPRPELVAGRPGAEPVETATATAPAPRRSIVHRWWFWTIIGVAVAGTVGATVWATSVRCDAELGCE